MTLPNIGIAGFGTYFPPIIETAADFAPKSGIPEAILRDKMGIRQRHIADDANTVTHMASEAAKRAIAHAGITPEQIRLVISHGSEYKDHLVSVSYTHLTLPTKA
jgi:3-oxoacyl-[acyl-carrier-protein] synthase-3